MTSAPGMSPRLGFLPGKQRRRGNGTPETPRVKSVVLGGVPVDLMSRDQALSAVMEHAAAGHHPLGVLSANLDHLTHFGAGGRWAGSLDEAHVEWLTLLDGAPLVAKAREVSGTPWPRLAGSDLIEDILDEAERRNLPVGFLGGSTNVQRLANERLSVKRPGLTVAGWWSPQREELAEPADSRRLAAEIGASGAAIVVVCLGKPRQELWIAEYGHLTGAKVLLAFGAVVDFLAGDIPRAPAGVANAGMEWAWRLALEPRRLAKRYLVDGPEAYLKLNKPGNCRPAVTRRQASAANRFPEPDGDLPVGFSPVTEHAKVAVLVVTYNSTADIPGLLDTLLPETRDQSIKVVVADNSPDPHTLTALRRHSGVAAFSTGGNLGYAGGINAAIAQAGAADAFLILNPDVRIQRGAVRALRSRMARSRAGVVVPVLKDPDGSPYPSLRREPSISRAVGDAVCGSRLQGRPGWLSEMDFDAESYLHAHTVDWATGAALLISSEVATAVGPWDERYFMYSEETDYLHRVRGAGESVWFEPRAVMMHSRGGSGTSAALDALMMANRIRYAVKHHGAGYGAAIHAAVVLSALLRITLPDRRRAFRLMARRKSWQGLPHAANHPGPAAERKGAVAGAVIIPAHNEAAVLGRALAALGFPDDNSALEVVVACNGCTDGTAEIARGFRGVTVIETEMASKTAALNAGDRAATLWPRVYVDADVEVPVPALQATLEALSHDGILCARPSFVYQTERASWAVRAYYRARNRIPHVSRSMWGAGIYGLSREGHERMGDFPALAADDCYIDSLFADGEKTILDSVPVTVRTPRTARALLTVLKRVYRSNSELPAGYRRTTSETLRDLASSVSGLRSGFDATVYAAFAITGRLLPSSQGHWERDESSRT